MCTCSVLRAGWCDGPGAQVLARALLRDAGGVELGEAWNGAEAVRRVREGGAYDLILTDRQMPVMDGHEVPFAGARAVTQQHARPVITVTTTSTS